MRRTRPFSEMAGSGLRWATSVARSLAFDVRHVLVGFAWTATRSVRDSSFANERKTLEAIVEPLDVAEGWVVDIAAGDGYTQSSTVGFFSRTNWSGLAVEMDSRKFRRLAYLFSLFSGVQLAQCRVTPHTVCALLKAHEVPQDFDVLNLDIDSYDLEVLVAMLRGGYRPKVISMEINEKIPPGIDFSVSYRPDHQWQGDHFFGCSLDAAYGAISPMGYSLVAVEYNNAFFVSDAGMSAAYPQIPVHSALKIGYWDRKDRIRLFPWNSDVDHWWEMEVEEAMFEINHYFSSHEGQFVLRRSNSSTEA